MSLELLHSHAGIGVNADHDHVLVDKADVIEARALIDKLKAELAASQAQIEAMKCCGNCENECDCNTDYREDRDSPNCCIGTGDKDMPNNWKLKGR